MVKKSEDGNILVNMKMWFIIIQGVFILVLSLFGFTANRLIGEFDDLQRQVHRLTVEVSVMKREMEIRNNTAKQVKFYE